jgi:hypothetical protein
MSSQDQESKDVLILYKLLKFIRGSGLCCYEKKGGHFKKMTWLDYQKVSSMLDCILNGTSKSEDWTIDKTVRCFDYNSRVGPDFGNASLLLVDIIKNEALDVGKSLLEATNILNKYIKLTGKLHRCITFLVFKIIKREGFKEKVKRGLRIHAIKQPITAKRPFHYHFSECSVGGGDLNCIVSRLQSLLHGSHLLVTPEEWCARSNGSEYYTINLHNLETQCEEDTKITASKCTMALNVALNLWALEQEVSDIYTELTSWKVLHCAMALHLRLGKNSLLGMMGEDVVRSILKFI